MTEDPFHGGAWAELEPFSGAPYRSTLFHNLDLKEVYRPQGVGGAPAGPDTKTPVEG